MGITSTLGSACLRSRSATSSRVSTFGFRCVFQVTFPGYLLPRCSLFTQLFAFSRARTVSSEWDPIRPLTKSTRELLALAPALRRFRRSDFSTLLATSSMLAKRQ